MMSLLAALVNACRDLWTRGLYWCHGGFASEAGLGVYESGPWLLAAITAAMGIGALVGTVFDGQVCLRRRGMMAFLAYILSGLALITFSLLLTRTLIPVCLVPAALVSWI